MDSGGKFGLCKSDYPVVEKNQLFEEIILIVAAGVGLAFFTPLLTAVRSESITGQFHHLYGDGGSVTGQSVVPEDKGKDIYIHILCAVAFLPCVRRPVFNAGFAHIL